MVIHAVMAVTDFFLVLIAGPAIYSQIKGNVMMALNCNRGLWENFYQLELSKSVVKLDIVMNCQFWTSFIFVAISLYDLEDDTRIEYIKYWCSNAIMFVLLVLALYSDFLGLKCIKYVSRDICRKVSFYSIRSFVELSKVYLSATLFLNKTMFWDDINISSQRFSSELKWYIAVNCLVTIVSYCWLIQLMRKNSATRELLATEALKAKYQNDIMFNGIK